MMASSGRSSPLIQLFQRSDSNAADNNNSSASSLMRSLSKCFDPPLDEAIVEDNGRRGSGVAGKAGNKGELLFMSHVMPFSWQFHNILW